MILLMIIFLFIFLYTCSVFLFSPPPPVMLSLLMAQVRNKWGVYYCVLGMFSVRYTIGHYFECVCVWLCVCVSVGCLVFLFFYCWGVLCAVKPFFNANSYFLHSTSIVTQAYMHVHWHTTSLLLVIFPREPTAQGGICAFVCIVCCVYCTVCVYMYMHHFAAMWLRENAVAFVSVCVSGLGSDLLSYFKLHYVLCVCVCVFVLVRLQWCNKQWQMRSAHNTFYCFPQATSPLWSEDAWVCVRACIFKEHVSTFAYFSAFLCTYTGKYGVWKSMWTLRNDLISFIKWSENV